MNDILNKSTIGGSLGGKRINHLLYTDDLCIVSLFSAGLQQLLSICDQYCASHSLTFNVLNSVCKFFRSKMNKVCAKVSIVLSGNNIEFVHETKYLLIINSSLKPSYDVVRQTRKFYAQANMLLRNFRYCTNDVKCMLLKSFWANMYCCPLWFNSLHLPLKS